MRSIRRGQPFTVIIDYAHTPGSFSKLLPEMKKNCRRKLIVLFGSAGERDREKRSLQGSIACKWADIIILADEDPRGEPPRAILEEIAAGCSSKREGEELFLIPDRAKAIEKAVTFAEADDTVLLLGKGHEQSIIYSDTMLPWDEVSAAEAALSKLGYNNEC
jgi:UDP-N-acetylmuramoyl-L-alanyl-D-glutamate--2,6-diaminopimelate ligase